MGFTRESRSITLEHLSETQLTEYKMRSLDPDELLAVDRHLASCDECHERLTSILPAVENLALESDEEPFHLDYEQHLEPYADGRANDIDREIVDSHVALCSKCATDLKDLLEFKRQPVAASAASSRWRQWTSPAWAAAAVVIAVFVLGGAVFLWTRSPMSKLAQEEVVSPGPDKQGPTVAKVEPSPATTSQNTPSPQPSDMNLSVSPSPDQEPRLMVYDAGGQLIVNQRGQLEGLQQLPPDLKESVEQALATGGLGASPALRGWSTGTNNLRSGAVTHGTFAPIDPIDVVVETDLPTFHWRALEGAQHYVVTIYDMKLRQVRSSGPVSGTAWTTSNSLERGMTYSWQVSALKDGETVVTPKPPLPEARFKILDQHAVNALAKLKEVVGRSHLAMGVFYWKHGLLEQAEREFHELARANPNSTAVTGLLASIRSLRGR